MSRADYFRLFMLSACSHILAFLPHLFCGFFISSWLTLSMIGGHTWCSRMRSAGKIGSGQQGRDVSAFACGSSVDSAWASARA